jgi:hypothetical protein
VDEINHWIIWVFWMPEIESCFYIDRPTVNHRSQIVVVGPFVAPIFALLDHLINLAAFLNDKMMEQFLEALEGVSAQALAQAFGGVFFENQITVVPPVVKSIDVTGKKYRTCASDCTCCHRFPNSL